MSEPIVPVNEHTWATFVRPAVKFKKDPDTRKLIEAVMPYYPKKCHCIAGYLNDADQFWKINYHWELLVSMLEKATALKLGAQSLTNVKLLLDKMNENPPNPKTGYKNSKVVGEPHDSSTNEVITKRWETMKLIKEAFRKIIDAEKITEKYPPSTPWDLSVAPVAKPGTSKHGCGYALDIEGAGLNSTIKKIAKGIGATLAFDEKSHVHVEFKHGVIPPSTEIAKAPLADNVHDGRYKGWVFGPMP
jgi:hypothetical protein